MTQLVGVYNVWNLAKHDVHAGGQIFLCTESIRRLFLKEISVPFITQNLMKA